MYVEQLHAIYPQSIRPVTTPVFSSGRFQGKMIYINSAMDSLMWPSRPGCVPTQSAGPPGRCHRRLLSVVVARRRGAWPRGADRSVPLTRQGLRRLEEPLAGIEGATQQGLRDVVRWVEDGVPPPPTSSFRFTDDGGLILSPDAASRGGIKPIVHLRTEGGSKIEVAVGEAVRFEGDAEVPPGAGILTWSEWDFEGNGAATERTTSKGRRRRRRCRLPSAYQPAGHLLRRSPRRRPS